MNVKKVRIVTRILLTGMVALVCMVSARAQTFDYAATTATPPGYNTPDLATDEVIGEDPTLPSFTVCPSFFPAAPFDTYDFPSTSSYQVSAVTLGAGDVSENTFIWVVYGGSITEIDGVAIASVPGTKLIENSSTTVSSATRHHVVVKGAVSDLSTITIQWDAAEVPNGWVAVQQRSEWDCSDDLWSRIDVNVTSGNAPVIRENSNTSALLGNQDQNLVIVLKDSPTPEPTIDLQALASTYEYSNESVTGATISFDQPSGENVNPVATDDVQCTNFLFYHNTNAQGNVVVPDPTAANASSALFTYGANTIVWTARDAGHTTSVTQNLYLYQASGFDIVHDGDVTLGCNPLQNATDIDGDTDIDLDDAFPIGTVTYTTPDDTKWTLDATSSSDVLSAPTPAESAAAYNYTRTRPLTAVWKHADNPNAIFTRVETRTFTYTYDETPPTLTPQAYTLNLNLNSNTEATFTAADLIVLNSNTDNSGTIPTVSIRTLPASLTGIVESGGTYTVDCSFLGTHTIRLQATDACGNVTADDAAFDVQLTIADNTDPIVAGIANGTYSTNTTTFPCRRIVEGTEFDLTSITENCPRGASLRFWAAGATNVGSAGSPIVATDGGTNDGDGTVNGVIAFTLGAGGAGLTGYGLELEDGVTTLNWQMVDASGNEGNIHTFDITIVDGSAPYVPTCGPDLNHIPYDYRGTQFPLSIPTPIDYCGASITSLEYSINSGSFVTVASGDYGGTLNYNFGSTIIDQTIVWRTTDNVPNTATCEQYMHLDYQPTITKLAFSGASCNGATDGSINIHTIDFEWKTPATDVEYTINGTDWQTSPVFTGLSAGTYPAQFRIDINGYLQVSPVVNVTITEPAAVNLSYTINPESCPGVEDASITINEAASTYSGTSATFAGGYMAMIQSIDAAPAAVTVSAWVKSNGGGTILGFDADTYFALQVSGSGNAYFTVGGSNVTDTGTRLANGEWHLVTGVWDGSNISLYIDGVAIGTPVAATMPGGLTRFGFIGADSDNAETFDGVKKDYFAGQISQVGYTFAALDAATIANHYANGLNAGAFSNFWHVNTLPTGTVATNLANISNQTNWGRMVDLNNLAQNDATVVTYAWTGPDGYTADEANIPVAPSTTLKAGTYTLSVTNNFGCVFANNYVIINDNGAAPTVTAPVYSPVPTTPEFVWDNDPTFCYHDITAAEATSMTPSAQDGDAACQIVIYFRIVDASSNVVVDWTTEKGYTDASALGALAAIAPLNVGTYTITWRVAGLSLLGVAPADIPATDATGTDYTDLGYTIRVVDNEAPRFTYPANIAVNNNEDLCYATHESITTATPTAFDIAPTDNCTAAGDLVTTYSISHPSYGAPVTGTWPIPATHQFPVGISTITITTTDLATTPNSTSTDINSVGNFTVTVSDYQSPTITLVAGGDAYNFDTNADTPGDCTYTFTVDAPTVWDNCAITLNWEITYNAAVIATGTGSIPERTYEVGVTSIRYWLNDSYNPVVEETVTVTITDNEAPTFDTPTIAASYSVDAGECTAVVNAIGLSNILDNCPDPYVTFSILLPDGITTVTDVSGTTDNASGYAFPVGTSTVTYTVHDRGGNNPTHAFNIVVIDDEKPVAIAKSTTVVAELDATGSVTVLATDIDAGETATPTSEDNCTLWTGLTKEISKTGADGTWATNLTYNCDDAASLQTVYYRVVDASLNVSATVTATLDIQDNIDPVITAKTNIAVDMNANACFATLTSAQLAAEFTDNCKNNNTLVWTIDHANDAGDATGTSPFDTDLNDFVYPTAHQFLVGESTVTYTIYGQDEADETRASAQITFTVTVTDTEDPVVNNNGGFANAGTYCYVESNTNATMTHNPTFTITDNCTVQTVAVALSGHTTVANASVTDNGDNTYTISEAINLGATVVTWTVTDLYGNGITHSYTLIFASENGFAITVPTNRNADVYCNPTDAQFTANVFTGTVPTWLTDLRDAVPQLATFTENLSNTLATRPADDCNNSRTRNYAAEWALTLNGSTACILTVNLDGDQTYAYRDDATIPTVTTQASDLVIQCVDGADNSATITAWLNSHGGAVATDNCTTIDDSHWAHNYIDGSLSDGCAGSGEVEVTFTVTDECGNQNTTKAFIRIIDDTDPVLAGIPANIPVGSEVDCDAIPSVPVSWTDITATDNCSPDDNTGITIDFAETSTKTGDAAAVGDYQYTITRTWTAEDQCGNSSDPSVQTIEVKDQTAPVIGTDASDRTVECDGAGNIAEFNDWLANHGNASNGVMGATATDNCAPEGNLTWTNNSATQTWQSGTCTGETYIDVTFNVADVLGNNTNTRTARFTIQDTQGPVVAGTLPNTDLLNGYDRPTDIPAPIVTTASVPNAVGDLETMYSATSFTVNDACLADENIVVTSEDVVDAYAADGCTYTVTRTYTFTDECTNASTAIQTFTVKDQILPVITKTLVQTTVCAEDEAGKFVENVAIGLTDDEISDNCATDAQLAATIEYRLVHTPAGGATDQTTATGTWISGNPATLTFYEGVTQVYYRITDTNNNISAELHAYTITVNHKPVPQPIAAGPSEVEGVSGGANMPLRYSTHTYTIAMEDATNNFALSGWQIETQAAPGVAIDNSHYTINSNTYVGNDVTVVIRFNRDMAEGDYNLIFTETTANSCATRRLYPFHLYAPFDVDIADAIDDCPDQSGSILAAGASTTTEVRYTINLVSNTYDGNWSFDFDIAIASIPVALDDATINTITINDPNGNSNLTYTGGGATNGSITVAYNSNKTIALELVVTYNDVHASEQQITVSLSEIKGQYNEPDVDLILDQQAITDGNPAAAVNVANDNTTTHLIQSLPAPGELLGVD